MSKSKSNMKSKSRSRSKVKRAVEVTKGAQYDADEALISASVEFTLYWIAHPRDVEAIGRSHARLIRAALNRQSVYGEL